jgi:hypothetical protein
VYINIRMSYHTRAHRWICRCGRCGEHVPTVRCAATCNPWTVVTVAIAAADHAPRRGQRLPQLPNGMPAGRCRDAHGYKKEHARSCRQNAFKHHPQVPCTCHPCLDMSNASHAEAIPNWTLVRCGILPHVVRCLVGSPANTRNTCDAPVEAWSTVALLPMLCVECTSTCVH